ncbi:MAG: hypothetical protein NC400_03280 [Clostridium sp.]|nr:hypothetical protein [Clostridium sp.]
MFGIFMESLVIFKLYTGLKYLLALSLLAWIYLLITEKNKTLRLLLVYAPIIVAALFLFPFSRKAFVALLDGEIYYRVLWTIPMGIIFCYGACRFFARHRKLGLAVSSALVILLGSYVYESQYITKAENLYHIPDTVIEICNLIGPKDSDVRVTAVMPSELIHFVRQYDASINMVYGREMLGWDYYNAVYEAMEKPEVVKVETLLEATRAEYCQYIVLAKERQTDRDPEECGLVLLKEIGGYRVYKDPVAAETVAGWREYYEE